MLDSLILTNHVLLVKKIEGPVWFTIYHHLPLVEGVVSIPSIHQPTQWEKDIYDFNRLRQGEIHGETRHFSWP